MLSLGIRHGLTTGRKRSRLVCSLRNSRQAEAPATALRAAEALASRPAEALTAATPLQREELVESMAAQSVEAPSEAEKAIWRRGRACSPVLVALLTALAAAQLAELLVELGIGLAIDSATELAADSAHVQTLDHSSV